jgi:lipid-A-disaccharide synthase
VPVVPAAPLIGMVAGESSGDFLGAQLIAALRERRGDLCFAGIGGPKMQAAGLDSWFPMERLAVRGYVEVLRHYPGLVAMRRSLRRRLVARQPAAFIGIDAPDFNLGLEASLKRRGIRTVHYVSPSVWAWRGSRVRRIARAADHLLALFPFEPQIYRRSGVAVTYVGHPLADEIAAGDFTRVAREQLKIPAARRVFALLPGSRQGELRYMGATFIKAAKIVASRMPQAQFLVPLASRQTRMQFETALYEAGGEDLPLTILFGHAAEAIAASDAVLVASGTATLETALHGKPMVIAYRMSPLTWKLMSRMRYQPWVGLPNIIAGEFLVPELLQDEATPENLAQALINVSQDPAVRERLPRRFEEMHALLKCDASRRAAEAVLQCIDGR